jgi:hypothetical protein
MYLQLHARYSAHVPNRTRYGIHYPRHVVAKHAATYERQEHMAAAFGVICCCEQSRFIVGMQHHAGEFLPELVAHPAVAAAAGAAVHLLHSAWLLGHRPPVAEVYPDIPVHTNPDQRGQPL